MKIFIVGGSGLVGSHCLNFFKSKGLEVIGSHITYSTSNTIYFNPTIESSQNFDLTAFRPDVIIHCGALTNVDYCENNEAESRESTVSSTISLAAYCKKYHAKLVYISTDYLFDGTNGPYKEDDLENPINVYGQHKWEAEQIVRNLPNYIIARITNVYGEEARDKNFVSRLLVWLTNNEAKTLALPSDQFATPIYAGDISAMLYQLILDGKKGIYHLSSTDYYNRYQLAIKVRSFFPSNTSVQVLPIDTASLKQPAKRPLEGGLHSFKFLSEYPDYVPTNIDSYLTRIINEL